MHLPPRFPAAKAIKYAEANPGVTRLGIDPKQGIITYNFNDFGARGVLKNIAVLDFSLLLSWKIEAIYYVKLIYYVYAKEK